MVGLLLAAHVATGLWWYADGKSGLLRALVFDRAPNFRVASLGQHQKLIEEGQLWRWFTSVWLHNGAVHLLINASGLWILGRLMEPWIGAWRWIGVFVLGGIGGSMASSFVGVTQSDGASGGGFALMAAMWVLGYRVRNRIDEWDRQLLGPIWTGLLIGNLLLGLLIPFVDAAAHAGGLLVGLAAGALLPQPASNVAASSD